MKYTIQTNRIYSEDENGKLLAEITFPVHFFQWIKRLVVEPQADQAVYLRLGFCLIPVQWITVFIE